MNQESRIKKNTVFFLFIILATSFAFVPRSAKAIIPTIDWSSPTSIIDNVVQISSAPATAMQETVRTAAHDVPFTLKEFVMKPIVSQLISTAIEVMKNMAIQGIISGNFGGPTFVTDFQANLKDAGKNAARGFLSQLTGLNFCNFYPNPVKQVFTLSAKFNLQCRVNISNYDLYLQYPWAFSSGERLDFTHNPSTNFVFLTRNAISFQADEIAQGVISKAAQTAQGFLGITKQVISSEQQAEYDATVQKEVDSCIQDYTEVNKQERANPPYDLTPEQIAICDESASAVPEPKPTEKVITPGQAVSDTLGKTLGIDMEKTPHMKELSEAISAIVNVAFQKALNDGLVNLGL